MELPITVVRVSFALFILSVLRTHAAKRCKYSKIGSQWSACDPDLHVRTKTIKLIKGQDECPETQTVSKPCKGNIGDHGCQYRKGAQSQCQGDVQGQSKIMKLKKNGKTENKIHKHNKNCRKKRNRRRRKGRKNQEKKNYLAVLPPKLTEVQVWPRGTSVELSWQPPPSGVIVGYRIGYGISIPDVFVIDVNASLHSYKISHLEPEQEYVVSLSARNSAGFGVPLYETIRTGRATDSDNSGELLLAPVRVQALAVSAYSMLVSWMDFSVLRLNRGEEATTGKMYTVRYMQLSHLSKDTKPGFITQNCTESPLLISSLRPFTQYQFAVRVSHGRAHSIWSNAVTNTTLSSASSLVLQDIESENDVSQPTAVRNDEHPLK